MRVTHQPLLTAQEWNYHWSMAAPQIKDPIEKKGAKTYKMPSIVVLDISRLGAAGQQLTSKFQGVLDACDLGNLWPGPLAAAGNVNPWRVPLDCHHG
jgi:hypothetical protein